MKTSNLQKVKVTEVFFEEDPYESQYLQPYPSFLLENGQLKRPRMTQDGKVAWLTDEEWLTVFNRKIITPDKITVTVGKHGQRK